MPIITWRNWTLPKATCRRPCTYHVTFPLLLADICSHMGRDEMERIGADAWDAEIWGAAHPSPTGVPRPKLFFYFGKNDHWVADHTRDDLIRLRGRQVDEEQWKPHMEIDDDNIPHGFSICECLNLVKNEISDASQTIAARLFEKL